MARGALGLPDLVLRAEKIVLALEGATEDGGLLSPASIEQVAAIETRRMRWMSVALWIIAFGILYKIFHG